MADFKQQVLELIQAGLQEKPTVFLVDFTISSANRILITLDGDDGITLQDCIDISRAVEHNLDRETIDFELEVASAGVGTPLRLPRQYTKNKNRQLLVKTLETQYDATLIGADENKITLEWSERIPKKIGKGKETVQITKEVLYNDIVEAIVTITF
jgi:ribosome maturation factor RimP